jgi:phosphatidylglycerol:prolipoprotein diacylglycerol transferase
MLTYPQINPVALNLGFIELHWYGLMYLLAFLIAYALGCYRARQPNSVLNKEELGDLLLFWGVLGVIIGGRLGYVLFYQFNYFLRDPAYIFKVWEGGMSFHGGLIGAILAMIFYARKHHKAVGKVFDFIAPLVPVGLGLGRIGNFINGELWGRPTDVAWGMVFPHVDAQARHATQLYEAALEGILLFAVLWLFSAKPRPAYSVSGLFLIGYGLIRFLLEYYREPDAHLGFVLFGSLTMGQLLSLPMLIAGIGFMVVAYKKK